MRILWTDRALTDLRHVEQFLIEKREAPASAIKMVLKIIEATEKLADYPSIGRPGRVEETRELVVPETPYLVPYRVKDGAVQILRVLHWAQKWPAEN